MRIAVRIIQVLVGILFILSGLVKANDPQGLSFKMQEFFEIWNADLAAGSFFAKNALINFFSFLHDHSLFLSVTMITLEIMAGVALLLGWKKKAILWLLLLLIVFFTFLTAYAYLSANPDGSPKFTNCGCFGDCLPLEPRTSFLKDLALLGMILFLLFGQKFIQPVFNKGIRTIILASSLLLSLLMQWYVLTYLPFVDCLPFKEGAHLPEKMKPPKNSVPSVYETRLRYRNTKTNEVKDMSQDEFNNSKIWEDKSWKWDTTLTKLVKKGNDIPEIQGFSLMGGESFDSTSGNTVKTDSTSIILSQSIAILGFGLEGAGDDWIEDLRSLVTVAKRKNIPVYFTSNNTGYFHKLFENNGIQVPVFSTDFTVIRTAARTNPAFYLLRSGTVDSKYSYRDINKLITNIEKSK